LALKKEVKTKFKNSALC